MGGGMKDKGKDLVLVLPRKNDKALLDSSPT